MINVSTTGLTLRNTFHGTEYTTRKSREDLDRLTCLHPIDMTPAERALVRKIRKALCGIEGCTCATNNLGER